MKFKINPYYNTEQCGLLIFDYIDTGELYDFNLFVIWKKLDDNSLWYDIDGICSIPFDIDRHNLKQITNNTFYNFDNALKNHYKIKQEDYIKIYFNVKQFLKIN